MQNSISRFTLMVAVLAGIATGGEASAQVTYRVSNLESLGGTNSRGNSVNDFGVVSGYSTLPGNGMRHAVAWFFERKMDLGALGNPATSSSAIVWPVKNLRGRLVGISQTDTPDPNDESWSCAAFLGDSPNTCLGFVWEHGKMRPLPPLEGGHNSFAAGANNLGEITGWAENGVIDPTCVAPQKLQFKPVIWGPGRAAIRELPLLDDDTSGAATAINDKGQAVGISGICDISVGRYTAAHAVFWDNGKAIELKGFDAPYWNTPWAINQRGDVVGFMGTPGDIDGNLWRAFIWIKGSEKIAEIKPLQGDEYAEAHGINAFRQVVGTSCKAGGVNCRAFLWENGVTRDISQQPGYTGVLINAMDINDFGVVTGRALDPATGVRAAFVAVPVRD
jgi:probable HAF family extracellular repeat protein